MAFVAFPAQASDVPPSGKYMVSGSDPGGQDKYGGSLQLTCEAEACSFEGMVDGESFSGVGIYDRKSRMLGVSFRGEDPADSGVTVLKWDGHKLAGHWMYMKNPRMPFGTEEWLPVK